MKLNTITVYALKSTRKNAKCKSKTFRMYTGGDIGRAKAFYSVIDVYHLMQFIDQHKLEYPVFQYTVYVDNVCLHAFLQSPLSSYQATTQIERFMELLNSTADVQ